MKKLSLNEFIERAKLIHSNKYDYSKVKYVNLATKVEIFCPVHGHFQQTPRNHLQGQGCPKCGLLKQIKSRTPPVELFIKKARKIHGSNYDYSKVKYINNHTNVEIRCKKHGKFFQRPSKHLSGHGCPKCGIIKMAKGISLSQEEFIDKANKIHQGKYDYSNAKYINNREKVKIICPIHGVFLQSPTKHISGHGCPECGRIKSVNTSGTSKQEESILSSLKNNFSKVYRNYNKDPRYPFPCDFYIPERDLFVEYNGYWTHGDEWYDGRKSDSKNLVETWSSKMSEFYKTAIRTFTVNDTLKRKTAKKNNLNYVVLWNEKDIEDWFTLGCPDGHDGDGMYTWRKN